MTEFLSLADAIAAHVRDGSTRGARRLHAPDPVRRGARDHPPGQARPDADPHDARPDLRPDDRHGLRAQAVFSWGGNPGVGSLHRLRDAVEHGWPRPLEIEEHSHAAMAAAYAAGAAGLPCAILRGYAGLRPAGVNPQHPLRRLPLHRRAARRRARASGPTWRSSTPSAPTAPGNVLIEGIIGVQKEVVAGRARSHRHRRGDRRRSARAEPELDRAAALDGQRDRRGAGRRASLLRARLLRARQRLLHRLGRHRARPRHVPRWMERARARARGRRRRSA